MSRNTTNTSLQTVALSDDARIATYYQMIANLINFFCDTKKIAAILVFQIQQIDSLVTSVCQIGCIGLLIDEYIQRCRSANVTRA